MPQFLDARSPVRDKTVSRDLCSKANPIKQVSVGYVKILVVGSSGNLGRELVEALAGLGHEVVGFDKVLPRDQESGNFSFTYFDLEHPTTSVEATRFDHLFLLAAKLPSQGRDSRVARTNLDMIKGFRWLLNYFDFGKVTYVSSSSVFSVLPSGEITPGSKLGEESGYARSKATIEKEVAKTCRSKDIPLVVIRPVPIVGKHSLGFFQQVAKLMLRRVPIPVPASGGGKIQIVDSQTVVGALIRSLSMNNGTTVVVANHSPATIRTYFETIASVLPTRPVFVSVPDRAFRSLLAIAYGMGLTNLSSWHGKLLTYGHWAKEYCCESDQKLTCTEVLEVRAREVLQFPRLDGSL